MGFIKPATPYPLPVLGEYHMGRKVLNGILVGLGFFFVGLGTVGIFLPVLPTVKFYLIALVCFAKGSPRFHAWFMGTKLYKKHLESFVKSRGMLLKTKLFILVPVTIALGFFIVRADAWPLRIMLGSLLVVKHLYFWFRIKTLPSVTGEQEDKID